MEARIKIVNGSRLGKLWKLEDDTGTMYHIHKDREPRIAWAVASGIILQSMHIGGDCVADIKFENEDGINRLKEFITLHW